MNKCIDCKHWKNQYIDKPTDEHRMCRKLSMCDPAEGVMVDMSGVYDEIGWECEESYTTGKDFGCIHFESR
jgi:hypothetical protein